MQSTMAHLNTSMDPDYDSFLNLDNDFTPAATSPGLKSVPMLTPQSSIPNSATTFPSSSNPQTFPGPSFQYDAYHQQTGIPIGALANTFNINKASGLYYHEGNGGFIMPTETLNMPLSQLDEFDFSRNPSDMDFEADSPNNDLPTMFTADQTSGQAQFVSPNTLLSQNNTSSTSVPRIYPGMHSQQAALAKAQQAQKQQHMARQGSQQQLPHGQKPLPGPLPAKSPQVKDPLVEESISKVLQRMRQASVASTADDDKQSSAGSSSMPRIKKDEDEMDEDERLLASEEGKKLSSKERRQLRNKVSARAFRSRRKGRTVIFISPRRHANPHQNTLLSWKAKLPPKHKRPTNCVPKTTSFEKRTIASRTLPACYSHLSPLQGSCKSLVNLACHHPTPGATVSSRSPFKCSLTLNLPRRISVLMRLLTRCDTSNRKLAWL